MELIDIIKNNKWAVAEGKHNKLPLIVRFRDELQERPNISGHPNLVRIIWSYDALDNGLPGNMVMEQLNIFEERLSSIVEHDALAVLVVVMTNDGDREWAFYARDVDEFANRLMNLAQDEERYPIELTSRSDPEWDYLYQQILAGMSGN